MDDQFDVIAGSGARNGHQSDSSIKDFKNFPRAACPWTPLDGLAFGVPLKPYFAKGPCFFLTPGHP